MLMPCSIRFCLNSVMAGAAAGLNAGHVPAGQPAGDGGEAAGAVPRPQAGGGGGSMRGAADQTQNHRLSCVASEIGTGSLLKTPRRNTGSPSGTGAALPVDRYHLGRGGDDGL
jgi:hypothetical protein